MSAKGDRESGRVCVCVGGDRSVSVKDETPKQASKRQTDRQNTLGVAERVRTTITGHIERRTKNTGQ